MVGVVRWDLVSLVRANIGKEKVENKLIVRWLTRLVAATSSNSMLGLHSGFKRDVDTSKTYLRKMDSGKRGLGAGDAAFSIGI